MVSESVGAGSIDWHRLLQVWMHDPVDKALDIPGHQVRAARYVSHALETTVSRQDVKDSAAEADPIAAISERIPMPAAGPRGERAVGPENGQITIRHPVSAQPADLTGLTLDERRVTEAIAAIVTDLPDDPRTRFLALWRLMPERMGRNLARLPADTRVPDHSLIQHADITSGIWASRQGARGGAYLSLSLGPVQKFIEAARSVRDLWSGSAILSWLTFQGIRPVIEKLGPTALVYPALRGNPLMDLWLREQGGLIEIVPPPLKASLRSPSIPNRFVALVPWGPDGDRAKSLAAACAEAVQSAWRRLADDVHGCLDPKLSSMDPGWAHRWQEQVTDFLEVRTATMPQRDLSDKTLAKLIGGKTLFGQVWPGAAKVRKLAEAIPPADRPRYSQDASGRWQAELEVSARLMEAQRSIRHLPKTPSPVADGHSPPKCSLLGSYEQMGPAGLEDSRRFWEKAPEKVGGVHGVRLRRGERFSAVALCKRFAAPATLVRELHLESTDLRFPDTATVASAEWLTEAGIHPASMWEWNGRWLHQRNPGDVEEGDRRPSGGVWKKITQAREKSSPPGYYAILAMDADHMGQWLKGVHAPCVRQVLHPKMVDYYERLGDRARDGLAAKRPVGPALHASISEALNNFASHVAPAIVKRHHGTMIYSGGDDVLALLPVRRAVACADTLRRAFCGAGGDVPGWTEAGGRQYLAMGDSATLSAGIAFVHYKEDLRLALNAAREVEKAAKKGGRNYLTLRFMRRSGEHAQAGMPWTCAPWFQKLVKIFAGGATDRWAYRLRAELPTLQGTDVPEAAVSAEIRRLVNRTVDGGASDSASPSGEDLKDLEGRWKNFSDAVRRHSEESQREPPSAAERLKTFVHLCQGASFIARGCDD